MAFQLVDEGRLIKEGISLLDEGLAAYAEIGDPEFDMSMDELLYERSALEFVRDQLSHEQDAELESVDTFWQSRPSQFNDTFARWHRFTADEKDGAMEGWVRDEDGKTPRIPRSHWWWWPIADGSAS